MDAIACHAPAAAPKFSASATPAMKPTIVLDAKLVAGCWLIAHYPACSIRTGLELSTNSKPLSNVKFNHEEKSGAGRIVGRTDSKVEFVRSELPPSLIPLSICSADVKQYFRSSLDMRDFDRY
jgi:hypothetical protein